METNAQTIFIALTGGIFPALLWLWFWLKEDALQPEPRGLIIFTFVAGTLSVLLVLPIEKFFYSELRDGFLLIVVWAATEEIMKYGAAYMIALKTKFLDEPIDCVIYMITAALGFAGLENALFLISTIQKSGLAEGLATQKLAFYWGFALACYRKRLNRHSHGPFLLSRLVFKKNISVFWHSLCRSVAYSL